jgi:uncharacterized membrane protein YgcG
VVHDLKSQEHLVFASVCLKTLGPDVGIAQNLYPSPASIEMEGFLVKSKALLGSVTERYYYVCCGNVLYEYVVDKKGKDKAATGWRRREHRKLRMVVPLGNVEIHFSPGRDIVLKPVGGGCIPVATRNKKFGIGHHFDRKVDKFIEALKADDVEDSDGDEEDGMGGKKRSLNADTRDEVWLSVEKGNKLETERYLQKWYDTLRSKQVAWTKKEEREQNVNTLFIETHGVRSREVGRLASELASELNAGKLGEMTGSEGNGDSGGRKGGKGGGGRGGKGGGGGGGGGAGEKRREDRRTSDASTKIQVEHSLSA